MEDVNVWLEEIREQQGRDQLSLTVLKEVIGPNFPRLQAELKNIEHCFAERVADKEKAINMYASKQLQLNGLQNTYQHLRAQFDYLQNRPQPLPCELAALEVHHAQYANLVGNLVRQRDVLQETINDQENWIRNQRLETADQVDEIAELNRYLGALDGNN